MLILFKSTNKNIEDGAIDIFETSVSKDGLAVTSNVKDIVDEFIAHSKLAYYGRTKEQINVSDFPVLIHANAHIDGAKGLIACPIGIFNIYYLATSINIYSHGDITFF